VHVLLRLESERERNTDEGQADSVHDETARRIQLRGHHDRVSVDGDPSAEGFAEL
jgi:hypothetical protein